MTQRAGFAVLLAVVIAVAAAVFVYDLGGKCLENDEFNMHTFATGERDLALSFGNSLGYFPILAAVERLSGSDPALRAPSVLFALLTVPVLVLLGRRMFGAETGLVAGALLAVSPMFVVFAQRVHAYAAFTLLSTASLLCLWTAYHDRRNWAWIVWAVLVGGNLWLHLYGVFVIGVELLIVGFWVLLDGRLGRPGRSALLRAAVPVVIILVITAPLIVDWIWPLGLGLAAKLLGVDVEAAGVAKVVRPPVTAADVGRSLVRVLIWQAPMDAVAVALILLVVAGCGAGLVQRRRATVTCLLWCLPVLLPIALFASVTNLTFAPRRLIFLLPVVMLLAGHGLTALARGLAGLLGRAGVTARPGVVIASATAVVVAAVLARPLAHYYAVQENPDVRAAAGLLDRTSGSQDFVAAWRPQMIDRYLADREPVVNIESCGRPRKFLRFFESHARFWYIRPSGATHLPRFQELETWLEANDALLVDLGGGLWASVVHHEDDPGRSRHRIEVLETLVAMKPERPYVYRQLAEEYESAGRIDESELALGTARRLDSSPWLARLP